MTGRPDFISHWRDLEGSDDTHYPDDDELMSIGATIGRVLGLTKIGIHHERLPPGRRTSYPHVESAEEEFVHVLEGTPDVWMMARFIVWPPATASRFRPAPASATAL